MLKKFYPIRNRRFSNRAWVISVSMGYGHQRTAFPLKDLAFKGKIMAANNYQGIPDKDRKIWEMSRKFYESISRFKRIPLIGNIAFSVYDEFQKILSFYPKRDLSQPNLQLHQIYSLIKGGWGRDLIERLKKNPLPLISTFFTPAFMAEIFNYPKDIFCVVCDADVSRTWAPLNPRQSKIKYFAPTERAAERLKLYGIKPGNIFLTGYPLPKDNISTTLPVEKLEILKYDLSHRLLNLDPKRKYQKQYGTLIERHLGKLPNQSNHPLTIMFTVGGAGAQKEIGTKIIESLAKKIKGGRVKIILVAGIRKKIKEYLLRQIKSLDLENKNIEILFEKDIDKYFKSFNLALKTTDVLWTKPSELSFYTALGLPIIIAPPIGSQEDLNQEWLLRLGSGMRQENPAYTDQWLFDLLETGWFAEAAFQGFIEGEKMGTFNIEKIIGK